MDGTEQLICAGLVSLDSVTQHYGTGLDRVARRISRSTGDSSMPPPVMMCCRRRPGRRHLPPLWNLSAGSATTGVPPCLGR